MVGQSRVRYENFLRIAEDLVSQDYLYDLQIRLGAVDTSQIHLILGKYSVSDMSWQVNVTAAVSPAPSQVGPMINVAIITTHSRSMTSGQYMEWINFSLRAKIIIDILVRRMHDVLRGVNNA